MIQWYTLPAILSTGDGAGELDLGWLVVEPSIGEGLGEVFDGHGAGASAGHHLCGAEALVAAEAQDVSIGAAGSEDLSIGFVMESPKTWRGTSNSAMEVSALAIEGLVGPGHHVEGAIKPEAGSRGLVEPILVVAVELKLQGNALEPRLLLDELGDDGVRSIVVAARLLNEKIDGASEVDELTEFGNGNVHSAILCACRQFVNGLWTDHFWGACLAVGDLFLLELLAFRWR